MNMSIRLIVLLIFLMAFAVVCSDENPFDQRDDEPPPSPANMVWIENDTVAAGERVAIDVFMENNEPLTGIVIPLTYADTTVSLDSLSFIGSRIEDLEIKGSEIDFENQQVAIYAYSSDRELIDSGSGLVCRLYFWVYGYSPTHDITIDSVSIPSALRLAFMDSVGIAYTPQFEPGILHVEGFDTKQ